MWLSIMSFIGGPVVKGLIDAYSLHLKATTTDKQTASNLAGQEIAAQTAENQGIISLRIAQIGHFWEPEKLAMYITLIFYGKVMIWDKCLGLGVTDEVTGASAVWAGLIMTFYFAKRGAENVSTIITSIKK
jgi:hypothetical protein